MSLIPAHLYCSHVKMMKIAQLTVQLIDRGGGSSLAQAPEAIMWCDATPGKLCPPKNKGYVRGWFHSLPGFSLRLLLPHGFPDSCLKLTKNLLHFCPHS